MATPPGKGITTATLSSKDHPQKIGAIILRMISHTAGSTRSSELFDQDGHSLGERTLGPEPDRAGGHEEPARNLEEGGGLDGTELHAAHSHAPFPSREFPL